MNFDLLDQIESDLSIRQIGIEEFAESSEFCNPPEAPLWMADLSFKPIGDVKVGDKVVGWSKPEGKLNRHLCESTILAIKRRQSPIVKVTMESGRSFRCTPDHLWLTSSNGGKKGEYFVKPTPGRGLVHVVDPSPGVPLGLERDAAWLGGMFDGEGSVGKKAGLFIAQSRSHNPVVCDEIERVLDLFGLHYTIRPEGYAIKATESSIRTIGINRASRQMLTNFVNWCKPIRRHKVQEKIFGAGWRTTDRIVSVEPDGEGEVVALTTSTGNYVANGYASKNCGKPLYPAQKVFLKLLFLEEMTGEEEDFLSYWIDGGTNNEITLSPQIRERRDWLREKEYPHFSEIVLVGGRRGSKGHVTGMAGAYKMWNTLNLQDPHTYYGIDRDKEILFSCVAGSESQAKDFQYADFSGSVSSCKAFLPYQKKTLETEFKIATPTDLREEQARAARGVRSDKVIARLKGSAVAANASTLRGSASIWICMDEMAHMVAGESKASANKVYDAAKPSLDQFGKAKMIFLNSSPASKVGKFFERHQEAMIDYRPEFEPAEPLGVDSYNGSPSNVTFQFPSWAMFERYKKYRSKWQPRHKFKEVITASPDWDPDLKNEDGENVFSEGDRTKIREARQDQASNPEVYKVERRGQFAEVIDSYLNAAAVDMMFAGVPRGFDDGGRPIYATYRSDNGGAGARNHFRYHFHLDPSSTTAGFGFAIGHAEEFQNLDGSPETHVVFDLIKRWDPKTFPGNTINWKTVIDEVITYADIFRPKMITLDQFQSAQPIQTLRQKLSAKGISGVTIELATATNQGNWYAAETFKTALNMGFVHAPADCKTGPAEPGQPYGVDQELKFLQQKNTGGANPRVDRQFFGPVTTKDMADCVIFTTQALIGNTLNTEIRARLSEGGVYGAPGGFQVGSNQNTDGLPRRPLNAHTGELFYDQGTRQGDQRFPGSMRPPRASTPSRSAFRPNRRRSRW